MDCSGHQLRLPWTHKLGVFVWLIALVGVLYWIHRTEIYYKQLANVYKLDDVATEMIPATTTASYSTTTQVDSSPVTTAANTTTTKRPDRDAGIQWILVLSYQRSGSSFIGRIFNDPGRVFYVYEPLDPVYSAMYGVKDTRTIPSDIFSTRDGQIRAIPDDELQAVGWAMERIYSCQLSSLPTAALAHSFWFQFQREMPSKNYVDCLQRNRVGRNTSLRCLKHIEERCAGRFLERPEDLEQCKSFLWGNESGDGIVPNGNKQAVKTTCF